MGTNKELSALIARVDKIHEKMEAHLEDAGNVRTNIEWIKKWTWIGISTSFTTLISLVVAILMYLLKR